MAPLLVGDNAFDLLQSRENIYVSNVAVPRGARIAYVLVSMFTTSLTTALLAYRMRTVIRAIQMRNLKPIQCLTLAVYFLGTMFSISAAICTFGFGFEDWVQCRAAILICLVFYLSQKLCLYLFLVERTHIIRSRNVPRYKNVIYLAGLFIVIVGFGIVATISFLWRSTTFYPLTGQCEIGLPAKVAVPLLSYDITINLALTGVFLYFVRPYMSGGLIAFLFDRAPAAGSTTTSGQNQGGEISLPQLLLKKVIRKTFWGCILILPSTVINLTILAITNGHQPGWMCLTFCTSDVLWCTIVIHWLTATPEEITEPGTTTMNGMGTQQGGTILRSQAAKLQSPTRSYRSSHRPMSQSVPHSYHRPISQSHFNSITGPAQRSGDHSEHMELVPEGIRCDVQITQDIEHVVPHPDLDYDPKADLRVSETEL